MQVVLELMVVLVVWRVEVEVEAVVLVLGRSRRWCLRVLRR